MRTDRGDELRACFVAMGTGPLHRPKLPGIEGIESSGGISGSTPAAGTTATLVATPPASRWTGWATSRWASSAPGPRRSSASPPRPSGGELHVFQRTPSSIDVRNNHEIEADWFATLEPGWQQRWLLNFATLQTGGFADEDLVKDGWTDIAQRIRDRPSPR
ncbi:MAG: hypothetical protein R2711_12110 [Acidimicrobiales bacterium]